MFQNRRFSIYVVIFLAIALIVFRGIAWPTKALTWDVFGYYLYLPATIIHDDPGLKDFEWLDEVMDTYAPSSTLYQLVPGADGNRVIKYTSGLALLYSPFFIVAHWLAPVLGYPADGFSLPYQLILSLGGIIWAIFGLILLRKLLLKLFDDKITSLTLLLIVLGTNYFQLAAFDGTLLSHNFLFTLYALLLFTTIRWHERPSYTKAFILGLSCGLITLIRPSEIICVLIPLLWNAGSWRQFTFRFKVIKINLYYVLAFVVPAVLVGSVQLWYWKSLTGDWLFYSYDNPGEGFRFFPPYIMEFLFSFRKGWFVYTPLMVFAFAGFYTLYKRHRSWFPALFVFVLLDLWIVSSWSCWWYAGGSFSARAMLPAYVLLAVPLASLIEAVGSKRWKWIVATLAVLLVALNLFQTWQFQKGIIDKERMTRDYYWAIFGKTKIDEEKLDTLLLVERSTETREVFSDFDRYSKRLVFETSFQSNNDTAQALGLSGSNAFLSGPDLPFHQITSNDHAWIHAKAECFIPDSFEGAAPLLVASFHHQNQTYKYRAEALLVDSTSRGRWNSLDLWYLTPEVRTREDNLKVYVWNRTDSPIYIRNFVVEVWEAK